MKVYLWVRRDHWALEELVGWREGRRWEDWTSLRVEKRETRATGSPDLGGRGARQVMPCCQMF